jgi:hypothetical protein
MQGSGDRTVVLVVMSNGLCGLHFYCYKGKTPLFFILHLPYSPSIFEFSNPNFLA